MIFDIEKILELQKLIKARPELYNHKSSKTKTECAIIWNEIAGKVGKKVSECRTVWTGLRSSYARHLQNMENNENGVNRRKKAEWYLASKMSFLNEFMQRPPKERNITISTNNEDLNSSTNSVEVDDSSTINLKFNNQRTESTDDDIHSIVTIKSEEEESLSEEIMQNAFEDNPIIEEEKTVNAIESNNYTLKKCRVELSTNDQNILIPKRNEHQLEDPSASFSKRLKMSPNGTNLTIEEINIPEKNTVTLKTNENKNEISKVIVSKTPKTPQAKNSFTAKEEIVDEKAREESTMMFFQSILFELRELTDRNLRLFKQDILQDLNKYLDEDENED
ncbi:uncharacterized protein LOC129915848 [Episyrphus balteatus]|uniref:uncharacterized protein LOC129915848 n=1 Tax=Episyrphus balteatus TaxID=286459 RepID=UPI002485C988|nr:uncharacterized protein LOC129915848 [Episyrphus balteatus]